MRVKCKKILGVIWAVLLILCLSSCHTSGYTWQNEVKKSSFAQEMDLELEVQVYRSSGSDSFYCDISNTDLVDRIKSMEVVSDVIEFPAKFSAAQYLIILEENDSISYLSLFYYGRVAEKASENNFMYSYRLSDLICGVDEEETYILFPDFLLEWEEFSNLEADKKYSFINENQSVSDAKEVIQSMYEKSTWYTVSDISENSLTVILNSDLVELDDVSYAMYAKSFTIYFEDDGIYVTFSK